MQATPGDEFHDIQNHFPFAKGIEIRRHGADIVGIGGKPDEMVAQAKELAQHHTDHLGPFRNVYIGQRFHRQQIWEIIGRAGQIIDPRQVGNKLVPGLALTDFFHRPMMVSNFQFQVGNLFTV